MKHSTQQTFTVCRCQRQDRPVWALVAGDGQPVEQAERFIHTLILRGLSPLTRRTYAYDLLAAYRWMAQVGRKPEQITGDDLVEFIDYLQRPPSVSPSTINRRLRLLQRFVEFLTGDAPVIAAWRQYNHALHFHSRSRRGSLRIKEPHRVIHPLKDRQVLEFYSSLRTWRDRSMVLLMWAEGLRAAEVLALTVNDIDATGQNLRIHGKGRKQRIMPLAEAVATTLRLYGQLERPTVLSEAVFLVLKGQRRGKALSMDGLRRIFRYHRSKSGIDQANPHRFRHSFGANMTRCRVPLLILARMMGHSSPHTTMRYVEIEDHELRAHYQKALDTLKAKGLLNGHPFSTDR
ncbi:MAG: tyrosine-type recombinase/integrase [Verrucomicrobia bacterium]|jgi:integrase/recombinase XerD|nr:tyrosine-type recombinase/integrase [Verrucomicrobiota bacterium]MBT7702485.1 tyrosine-type recombinase/integrase [Verrucomicrobiota bacterium]